MKKNIKLILILATVFLFAYSNQFSKAAPQKSYYYITVSGTSFVEASKNLDIIRFRNNLRVVSKNWTKNLDGSVLITAKVESRN